MESRQTTQTTLTEEEQPQRGHVSAPGTGEEPKDNKPTTGIPALDKLIEQTTYESQAMAYACLDLIQRDASLGDRIYTLLDSNLDCLRGEQTPRGADFECDVAPATKWLRFTDGFEAGCKSKSEPVEPAAPPVEEIGEAEIRQSDREIQEKPEIPKLESEEPQLEPAAEAEEIVKRWLLKQSYQTKLAFTILSHFGVEDHGTKELFDEIDGKYEAEVIGVAKNPAADLSPEEVLLTGYACELLVEAYDLAKAVNDAENKKQNDCC